jgi:hypothetical protein
MILGGTRTGTLPATTLDDLFQRAAARRPDAPALIDPPNRADFTDGPPRRLSYAQADRAIAAVAARLREIGLPTDAAIGIQLPNTVEFVVTVLGVLRAGMIAAPLPLLWRRAEIANALGGIGARAVVTAARIGEYAARETAVQVAADVFPIRHVCAFGGMPADGVVAFDDILDDAAPGWAPPVDRDGDPASHVALVSFDVTPDGVIPVARSHAELSAGGLAALLEGGIGQDTRLLGCIAMGSFGGLALTMLPWLLSGGTLSLHHGFDAEAFARQCREERCDAIVVPGPLLPQLAGAGLFDRPELKSVLAAWRAPERCNASPAWEHTTAALTDMMMFGETALIGTRRGADGLPVALPAGVARAPSHSANGVTVAELARSMAGTIALRGPMVPQHPFPPGVMAEPRLKADAGGFVDAGYPCRIDAITGTLAVTGPPPGIVSVGSYRFVTSDLQNVVERADPGAFLTALPDALAGHRLAGISGGGDTRAAVAELGVNPLIAEAFRGPVSKRA